MKEIHRMFFFVLAWHTPLDHFFCKWKSCIISIDSNPGLGGKGGKRGKEASYLLFVHARSIPMILGDRDTPVNLPAYLLCVIFVFLW